MYLNKLNGEKFSYCVVKMLAGIYTSADVHSTSIESVPTCVHD